MTWATELARLGLLRPELLGGGLPVRGERLRGVSRSREERRPHVTLGVELYHRRPHGRCWDELIFEMHDEPRKRRDACTALSTRGI